MPIPVNIYWMIHNAHGGSTGNDAEPWDVPFAIWCGVVAGGLIGVVMGAIALVLFF